MVGLLILKQVYDLGDAGGDGRMGLESIFSIFLRRRGFSMAISVRSVGLGAFSAADRRGRRGKDLGDEYFIAWRGSVTRRYFD
jgi:hypothetical protein